MKLEYCTATGMQLLARSVPMARAALQAASPDLRKLGVEQIGRAMQVHILSSPLCTCGVIRHPCACTQTPCRLLEYCPLKHPAEAHMHLAPKHST